MKFVFAIAIAACIFVSHNVSAAPGTNHFAGWVTSDSGENARAFRDTYLCESATTGPCAYNDECFWNTTASCPAKPPGCIYVKHGKNPAFDKMCCELACIEPGQTEAEFEAYVQSREAEMHEIANVFDPSAMTEYHWGYYQSTNRSSNNGRTTSAGARLDVCLGNGNVDTITASANNDADRYSNCAGSTYGCGDPSKNGYCQNNSSAVCIDRCACYYPNNGVDTCNSL